MLETRPLGRIRFQLLGQAAGLFAGQSNAAVRISTQKGFALLAYLAMNAGRPVSRGVLADLLWGDRVEAQARQSLRQAILTLRRDLGAAGSASLNVDDQSLSLAIEADDVDALQFAACAASADPAQRQRCLQISWAPFLDNLSIGVESFDEWVVAERHRLDAIATRVFSDLARQFDEAGDGERAILAMERLIALDPANEERLRRLLILEARYRGPDAALARAKELVARLKREVDAEPEAATRATIDDIKRRLASSPGLSFPSETRARTDLTTGFAAATGEVKSQRAVPAPWLSRETLLGRPGVGLFAVIALIAAGLLWTVYHRPTAGGGSGQPAVASSAADSWQSPGETRSASSRLVPIAVLPFTTSGAEAEALQPTAETVTNDLTNILSRVPGLRVISRQTMRAYRERAIDIATIGTELGVRYVLEGSMHKVGDRLRVNAELIDPRSRSPVWSDRFEREIGQQHEILDEIVGRLGRQLQMSVTMTEAGRAATDPSVAALLQKGWATHYSAGTRGLAAIEQARSYFSRALEQEPDNVSAKTGLAAVLVSLVAQDSSNDHPGNLDRAETLLREAMAASPRSNGAHYYMGVLHRVRGRPMDAIASFEQSIEINPSHASSYAYLGFVLSRVGQPAKGLEYIQYAIRLSPKDPILSHWLNFAGFAELELERDASAIESFRRALGLRPGFNSPYVGLAAAYALTGRLDEAHRMLAELRALAPKMSGDRLLERFGDRGTTKRRLTRGLELALAPAAGHGLAPGQRADNPARSNVGTGATPVVVLPFTSHAETGDQAHLVADILTDDLTVQLSRIPGLLVTARQSAFAYKGKPVDIARIASELKVRYLLEGSVRPQGQGLRINVALVDAANGLHLWNTRFVHEGAERNGAHDEIVARLSRELQVEIYAAESKKRRDDPFSALMFKGWDHLARAHHIGDDLERARAAFAEALSLQPNHSRALTGMAAYHVALVKLSLNDHDRHFAAAEAMLRQVIASGRPSPMSYSLNGQIHRYYGRIEQALRQFDLALAIDANNPSVHAEVGHTLLFAGRVDEALERIHLAMRLSPNDFRTPAWLSFAAEAELERGNVGAAIGHLRKAKEAAPGNIRILGDLAAAHALAGRAEEARTLLAELRQAAPHLSDANLIAGFGGDNPHRARISQGMREALARSQLRGSVGDASRPPHISQHP